MAKPPSASKYDPHNQASHFSIELHHALVGPVAYGETKGQRVQVRQKRRRGDIGQGEERRRAEGFAGRFGGI